MRTFLVITLLFLALLGGGVYLKEFYQPSEVAVETPITITTPTSNAATTTTPETLLTKKTTPVAEAPAPNPVVVTSTPEPVSSAPTITCVRGGSCTPSEVATHNTRTDCYVSMSNLGKVYDVTDYVQNSSVHPGGDISDYCGVDIFLSFTGQSGDHRHSGRAMQDLTAYEFATLN